MANDNYPAEYDENDVAAWIENATPEMLTAQQRMVARVDSRGVTYSWKDGINRLRLLPGKKGVGQAYFAVRQHWVTWPAEDANSKPRPRSFLCLQPAGAICPLCELAASLQQDPNTAEEGKRMESRPAYIYNGLDMADPDGGPKVVFFSWEAHTPIAELWENQEDPTHYLNGPIFAVKREKRGRITYTTTPLSARHPVPISVLKNLHDLRKYGTIPSQDTLEHAVGVITGIIPAGTPFTPALPAARQTFGSRAAPQAQSQPMSPPPRRTIGSVVSSDE